jgi:cytochrome c553
MRTQILLVSSVLAAAMTTAVAAGQAPRSGAQAPSAAVQRGSYFVNVIGCDDCHTPHKMGPRGPEPDMSRRLSGHPADFKLPPAPSLGQGPWVWAATGSMTAFSGPWGVSFTANLTPDAETGLGTWTEQMFIDAIRTGRHLGKGRPILPPMPIQAFRNASDQDLRAIFAFLKSLPPVKNKVPEPLDPPQSGQ